MTRASRSHFVAVALGLAWGASQAGCNDGEPGARAFQIQDRRETIGGSAALLEIGDFVLENDRIRLGFAERGNSVGPGVFGGSLLDADVRRPEAPFRGGHGKDQFSELFPVGNLSTPAICLENDPKKIAQFCRQLPGAGEPRVRVVCDGVAPCVLDTGDEENAGYALPGVRLPSEHAALLRVEGQAGNYLEALALTTVAGTKNNFFFRNDYILEPGEAYVRIRTTLTMTSRDTGLPEKPNGTVAALPPLTGPVAVFGVLFGSQFFNTPLPDMLPGMAGGDFLYFGDRLSTFAPLTGFDIYKDIRSKYARGLDPLNDPIATDYMAGVGENVSYAIASADPGGKLLIPLFSGSVTVGYTHGAYCSSGPCQGTAAECQNVLDCTNIGSFAFERLFAIGDGDVASAAAILYQAWGVPLGSLAGHVLDQRTGAPVGQAEVHVYRVPATLAECQPGGDPATPYRLGPEGFAAACLERRHYLGAFSHLRTDRHAADLPAGAFEGQLPVGRYYLVAKKLYHPVSGVLEVEIREGETTRVSLALAPPGRIQVEVVDDLNRRVPAKITVGQCFPNCAGRQEGACAVDADCPAGKCVPDAAANGATRRCLIDNCPADRACDAVSSRCLPRGACARHEECEPVERCLPVPGAGESRCQCLAMADRKTALGEGAYPVGLARYAYAPAGVAELEVEPGAYDVWASRGIEYSVDRQQVAVAGAHTATVEARLLREVDTAGWISGDFHVHGVNSFDAVVPHEDRVIAFAGEGVEVLASTDHDYLTDWAPYVRALGLEPWVKTLVGEEITTVELGHFIGFPLRYQEWQGGKVVPEKGAIDWTGKVPDELFDELRALGPGAPAETLVLVPHPRDPFMGYYQQYGLNPFNPYEVKGTLFEWFPPFIQNPLGDPALFSGRFDAQELFNGKRFDMIRTPSAGEMRAYNLARDRVEAHAAGAGESPDLLEQKIMALDRRYIRDVLRRNPGEQDGNWEADGTQKCELWALCASDADCDGAKGERCDPDQAVCVIPCSKPADCAPGACVDGTCDRGWAADAPCIDQTGVIDDWFRLIDYGVYRPGLGDSDTHKVFGQNEAGCPRNFIRQDAESPPGIDPGALVRSLKAGRVVASYGPFVEVTLGDRGIGEVYSPPAGVATASLRIRVQSPLWFDVDRVEVYRSGRLIHVFSGAGDELDPQSRVNVSGLALPNSRVVNLDAVLTEPLPEADSWYVVIAMGLEGRNLSPVFGARPYLDLEVGDILARSFESVPVPIPLSQVMVPRVFPVFPYAVTNPVFLDRDGNGKFDAPQPAPDWVAGGQPPSDRSLGAAAPSAVDLQTERARGLKFFLGLMAGAARGGR